MGFTVTFTKRDPSLLFDYIGTGWDIFRYSYLIYKIYNRDRFEIYDMLLFTKLNVKIDAKTLELKNVSVLLL